MSLTIEELKNQCCNLYEEVRQLRKRFDKQQEETETTLKQVEATQSKTAELIAEMEAMERHEKDKKRWKKQKTIEERENTQ